MTATTVYAMRAEYKPYNPKNFATNLRNLRSSIQKQQKYADEDSAALAHDLLLHPHAATDPRGYPRSRWDGSKAQRLLKLDIDAGEHEKMKPEKLHATRTEYQDFPLKVFRDHINQETKSRREKAYWLNRPQKGKQKGWGNEE